MLGRLSMEEIEELLSKAARCRRLARTSVDKRTVEALTVLAVEIEAEANAARDQLRKGDSLLSPPGD